MKRAKYIVFAAVAAFALTACETPTNTNTATNVRPANANGNSNTNTSTAAAPTTESLMALENKATEAWRTRDLKFWDGFLSAKLVGYSKDGKFDKAGLLKIFETEKCDVKSVAISDGEMTQLGPDAALVTYKLMQDGTCNGEKIPASVWAATVYVREGGDWKALYHSEAPMPDPNAKPSNNQAPQPTGGRPGTSPSPATAAPDAVTTAVFDLEKKAWEAWKSKDAKALEEWSSPNMVSFTDKGREKRADAIKTWTTDGCEVKTINLSDPTTVSLGPDHTLLIFRSATDGKCGGQQIPALIGSSVYAKEGGTWKALFTMNAPSM